MKIKSFNRVKQYFSDLLKPDGHDDLITPPTSAEFALLFEHQPVGVLSLEKGIWSFRYASQFKMQTNLKPLPEFPDVNKVYLSETLWPFFAFRIPGMNQPQIKELAQKEGIVEGDIVKLLGLFGRKSINNPFELELKEY